MKKCCTRFIYVNVVHIENQLNLNQSRDNNIIDINLNQSRDYNQCNHITHVTRFSLTLINHVTRNVESLSFFVSLVHRVIFSLYTSLTL